MVNLPELTVYISHTCDLACEGCFTYNHLNWSGHFKPEYNLEQLRGLVEFNEVFLIGGEPTLNPYLKEWMDWVEYTWPSSKKWIVTNGRHLDKLENISWSNNWNVEISAHSPTDLKLILDWLTNKNIVTERFFNNQHTDAEWHYRLLLNGKDVGELSESWNFFNNPAVLKNNQEISWSPFSNSIEQHNLCPAKECMHLLNGRFYRCHQQALLPILNETFKIADEYKSIAKQDVGCSPDEFLTWAKTRLEPQTQCSLCNWNNKIVLPAESKIKKIKVLKV